MKRKSTVLLSSLGISLCALGALGFIYLKQGNRITMTDAQAKKLGNIFFDHPDSKNGKMAFNKLESAAKAGVFVAQFNLGLDYESNSQFAKANYWFTKGAANGHAIAEYYLAYNYDNGDGVTRDHSKADYWYKKAAQNGYAAAQDNLGNAYVRGQGVPKNYAKAIYWHKKSAEQGNALGQFLVGVDYMDGVGVPKNYTKADYWFKKSVKQGFEAAQLDLGIDYYLGRGVARDPYHAVYLWKKAAAQGSTAAQQEIRCAEGNCS